MGIKLFSHRITTLIGAGVVLCFFGYALWLERYSVDSIFDEYRSQVLNAGGEFRVTSRIQLLENPLTWFDPQPSNFVSRIVLDDSDSIFADEKVRNLDNTLKTEEVLAVRGSIDLEGKLSVRPLLIVANCDADTFRFVDRAVYQAYLDAGGFTPLGRQLPKWKDADVYSMAWALSSAELNYAPAFYYDVVCQWSTVGDFLR